MGFPLPPFLFCILILSPFFLVAQSQSIGNVTPGASHTASDINSTWLVSPSGDFAFGFQHPNEDKDLFLLSIWYAKIPEKTIVWYANRDNLAPRGSKVELTADRGLVLTAQNGSELWKTESLNGTAGSGFMNDTGNLVLQGSNRNINVWESFNDPRDTLLPLQIMERGRTLSSRLSESNFSKGRFQLQFLQDGNLVLNSINLPTDYMNENYYQTNTNGLQLVFGQSGDLYVLSENNTKFNLTSDQGSSSGQLYFRATMDFDGLFTVYSHPKDSFSNWTALRYFPENMCLPVFNQSSGVCGYNSYCSLENNRPVCKCPTGYSLLDPNDPNGSCKPDFIQGCKEDELSPTKDLYEIEVLNSIEWPYSDYVQLKPFSEEECKQSCLEDCMCAVAISRIDNGVFGCWKKKLPLSNGRVQNRQNLKALIKVRKDNSSLPGQPFLNPEIRKRNENDTLILVLLSVFAFLTLILLGALWVGFSIYQKKLKINQRVDRVNVDSNLRYFSYEELIKATDGFKDELGRGAFGVVYKGAININMGSTFLVGVKKLTTGLVQEGEKEFRNEVNVIGRTHHKNLVRLLGFCEEGPQRLLVYEYMSNGTLASFLFGDSKPAWNQRIQITFGIARGLLYLHDECSTQIIHCDIKPQNILLDDYNNARISDFGLAKLLQMNQSQTNTAIRGTKGYVAGEWFRNMPITAKVDVYSFGILLLEIICCRRSVDMEAFNEEQAILTDWAYDCYREGTLYALVENDEEALNDKKNLERLVMVALWCIQEDPYLRPTMRKVTLMLEGVVEVLVPPCPSPYTTTAPWRD
ncbi:Receptor-like protein kinase [Quillaja saponaria]|uniref:Receptor-like serine/threonine-protein kinase n=1 Tax=Quillaja saponaria TaxID=32244 RepID=A0AAD7VKB0_QUISA|nr:Receptor-like protein kinase [Quillaja saponaria]